MMATQTDQGEASSTENDAVSAPTHRDRRPSLLDEVRNGAQSPQDLLQRMSLIQPKPDQSDTAAGGEQPEDVELNLSGNVISATFCVPYKIGLTNDHNWIVDPRRGTSALFDSFAYLASSQSEWRHTLVGWTGEVDAPNDSSAHHNSNSGLNGLMGHSLAHPLYRALQTSSQPTKTSELHVSVEDRRRLESQLELLHGGRITPVWLPDDVGTDGTFTLREQQKWRRYGEHELFTLFHYKLNEPAPGEKAKKVWQNYTRMNEAFTDRIMEVYSPGDIIIVHDYHLALLPKLLRQRLPNAYIGFFLHIPFPSSEYYRCLPKREEVLKGMLGANMIGFQTNAYRDHFASCYRKVFEEANSQSNADPAGILTVSGRVPIEACAIGINAASIWKAAFEDEGVQTTLEELQQKYAGLRIIIGRDRLDSIRGVAQKLEAFYTFLDMHPEWRGKVMLIQVTSPTSIEERDGKHEKTESKITELVVRINSTFGTLQYTPVKYSAQYLCKNEYFAFLRLADVALITSVRDGMNTTALEYVVCQHKSHAPLIISEFSGTADSLRDAIQINPWSMRGVSDAILRALTMSNQEKTQTHARLYQQVMSSGVQSWVRKYIQRLTTNLKASGRMVSTPALDREAMITSYRNSKRRLFMFDYDGTLTPIVRDPNNALPSDRIIRTLKALASDPRNAVWIVSGRPQDFLEEWMGHIPALGLSAEHGCFTRNPNGDHWQNLTEQMDLAWHEKVIEIFGKYTNGGTNGTHVERKRVALTWHYRGADPAWSADAAKECLKELQEKVEPFYEVDVMKGKMNLEVRPRFVNKGEIAKRLVEGSEGRGPPDFVVCMGDDHTDEGKMHDTSH